MNNDKIKFAIIGDSAIGKTSLLMTYSNKRFPSGVDDYTPTVLDFADYPIKINKDKIVSIIGYDTGGGEYFHDLRLLTYPEFDVVIVCFSQSDRNSYRNCKQIWKAELENHIPTVPIILVQTKIDLINSENIKDKSDFITHKEGIQMSKDINALAYFECSSRLNQGLDEIFVKLFKIGSNYKNNKNSNNKKVSTCMIL